MPKLATRPIAGTMLRVAALFLAGLNLRTVVVSVPPISQQIAEDLGLNGVAVGLLITTPVLCLGLFAPAAPTLICRLGGPSATVTFALVVLTAGLTTRLWADNLAVLYAGTLVSGAGIGLLGAALPSAVRLWFPFRAGAGTVLYATAMAIGATISGGGTAELVLLSGSWTVALAAWAIPAGIALLCWLPTLGAHGETDAAPLSRAPGELGIAKWAVITYCTCQSLQFFSQVALLPGTYSESGWSVRASGMLFGAYHLGGFAATLVVPVLADKWRDRRPVLGACTSVTVAALIAVVVVPTVSAWLTMIILGAAQTGGFVLGLALLAANAASPKQAAKLAGTTFLISYPIAAAGPALLGGLHDISGSYVVPLVLLAVLGVFTVAVITRMAPTSR